MLSKNANGRDPYIRGRLNCIYLRDGGGDVSSLASVAYWKVRSGFGGGGGDLFWSRDVDDDVTLLIDVDITAVGTDNTDEAFDWFFDAPILGDGHFDWVREEDGGGMGETPRGVVDPAPPPCLRLNNGVLSSPTSSSSSISCPKSSSSLIENGFKSRSYESWVTNSCDSCFVSRLRASFLALASRKDSRMASFMADVLL